MQRSSAECQTRSDEKTVKQFDNNMINIKKSNVLESHDGWSIGTKHVVISHNQYAWCVIVIVR